MNKPKEQLVIVRRDIQKYPNDADLGKYIRQKFLKIHGHGGNI
jgi:hypothetical protein|tara:strand:+ start:845 stop:973 length:129 start_codon:yes stop_codon:yes gene_type:complete